MPQSFDRVYTLLDNGNNAAAVKQCDLILKKLQKKRAVEPSSWQTVMGLKDFSV